MTRPPPRPEYKVYRSRRNPLDRLRGLRGLEGLRRTRPGGGPRLPVERPPARRVLKWVALGIVAWLGLAFALFFISAQLEQDHGVPIQPFPDG